MARWALTAVLALLSFGLGVSAARCAGPDDAALLEHARADSVATARYARERDSAFAEARAADHVREVAEMRARVYAERRTRLVVRVDTLLRGVDTVTVSPAVAALLADADTTIAAQGAALRADSAAIASLRVALVRADTAIAAKDRRVVGLEAALGAERRRRRWSTRSVVIAVAAGAVASAVLRR